MSPAHRIVGYDKRTERLAFEFDVPEDRVEELRALAGVEQGDVGALGCYPLTEAAARATAADLCIPMALDRCDWFLEPAGAA